MEFAAVDDPRDRPRSVLHRAYDRFGHLLHELGKFGVVGGLAYGLDTGIYLLLLMVFETPYLPKTIATVIAATAAFLGNRFWTWRHRERNGLAREYALYFGFNLAGLAITLVVLWISYNGLGAIWPEIFQTRLASLIAGSIVGNVAASAFRFWSYRRFVFLEARPVGEVE